MNLTRLQQDFGDADVGADGYFKLDKAILIEALAPLHSTFCPLQPQAMLQAVLTLLHFYQDLAPSLVSTYGIPYPANLERILPERLIKLGVIGLD